MANTNGVPPVPKFTTPVTLEPVTFTPDEIKELLVQRKICGWNYEPHHVDEWRECIDRGEMTLFWIVIDGQYANAATPSKNEDAALSGVNGVQTPSHGSSIPSDATLSTSAASSNHPTTKIRAGHVALASQSHPPHPLLARPDRSILTISTFFIHPAHRSLGLGRLTLDIVEPMATQSPYGSPNCREICVDTMSAKYVENSGGSGGADWEAIRENAKMSPYSKQRWYERRGYVTFH